MFLINFTKVNAKFCLSLCYNGANSYLIVNGTEIHKFTAKGSMIVPDNLCLRNVSKDYSASNMKKTGFNGYIYDFSVDYNTIDVNDIKNIRMYLMKKEQHCIKLFRFVKQIFVSTMMFFSSLSCVNSLECVSMNNQECKVRPEIININSNDPILYPFSVKTNKCSDNCNNISDP